MKSRDIADRFRQLQLHITAQLEQVDGRAKFKEDNWNREEGGGGHTRVIIDGAILEKGGVAFSAVHGDVSDAMKQQLQMEGASFFATGVSIVLHPKHPRHPIMHMNVRYFELDSGEYWFGGGIDMTPHYVDESKAILFHRSLKEICDQYHADFYREFKPWADRYFYLPHRNETRGIGGIFYDHKNEQNTGLSKTALLNFSIALGELFPVVYSEQVKHSELSEPSTEEKQWQALRRGRYVEFNLLHDKGTKFGIYSGGRTESILMSMPPVANWKYDYTPTPGSEEEATLNILKTTTDWITQ
jgi:coproporphyrinogen III oxidase